MKLLLNENPSRSSSIPQDLRPSKIHETLLAVVGQTIVFRRLPASSLAARYPIFRPCLAELYLESTHVVEVGMH